MHQIAALFFQERDLICLVTTFLIKALLPLADQFCKFNHELNMNNLLVEVKATTFL
jgi:hypothetical protein